MSEKLHNIGMICFVTALAAAAGFSGGSVLNQDKIIGKQQTALEQIEPPVEILETISAKIVDGRVLIQFRVVRHRNCPLEATTEWRNRENTVQPVANPNKAVLLAGEEAVLEIPNDIPPSMPRGPYDVRAVGVYDCNGLIFKVTTDWRSVVW